VPVLDAVGLICGSAETGLSVRLIFRVVSLEPDHLAVPLKRKPAKFSNVRAINIAT
jgi:hypothetical protein